MLRLRLYLTAADLDAALEHGAIFHADANRRNVALHHALAANIHAVAAFDVPGNLAHNHNFTGGNVGLHGAVASDGHSVLRQRDRAFDAAIDVERFRAADVALDDQRTANGGLLHGGSDGFDWGEGVGVG